MQTLPSIKQLQYLIALQEHASFSEAAAASNVTQSTLSAAIAALEDLLGQRLADRSQRQISLTPLGLEVAEESRAIVARANALLSRAQSLQAPLSGPLRLGVIPTIAPFLLPDLLPALDQAYPLLELQLREDLSERLVEHLRTGAIDVALIAFPYDTPGMEQEELFQEPFVIACARGQWRGDNPARLGDLESEKLLLLEEGHCLRDHALTACKMQGRRDRSPFSATSLATLIQMVGHGYGVTLLPEMTAQAQAMPKTIEIVPFAAPAPARSIGIVWRRGNPQARDFALLGRLIRDTRHVTS